MNRKFIIRSLAAAAISLATKIIVKKLQEKPEDNTKEAKSEKASEIRVPETAAYPPQTAAI